MRAVAIESGIVALSIGYAAVIYALAPDAPWLALYRQYAWPIISLVVFSALLLVLMRLGQFAYRSRGEGSPTRYLLDRTAELTPGYVLARAWPVAVLIILMPAFNVFKQAILPHAGFHFDPELAYWDALISGSNAPGLWLVEHFNSPTLSQVIDLFYHAWFFPMVLGVVSVAFSQDASWRHRYMLVFVLAWILMGSLMAFAIPAAGPFYFNGTLGMPAFSQHISLLTAHQMASGELQALTFQGYLRAAEANQSVVIGGGISAMPSMHNAFALLFALAMWRHSTLLASLLAVYALIILGGSVYLGWHYVVDGLIGWLGIAVLWCAVGRLVGSNDH